MKSVWLSAAIAACALAVSAQAAVVVGIPPAPGGGVHGIIIRHHHHHRCHGGVIHGIVYCHHHHHHPILGRRVIHTGGVHGLIINRGTVGVRVHGIGPAGPVHGGLVNGIPAEQNTQH